MPTQPTNDFRIQHLREKLGELYEFQALLGRGAFAAVYLVRNLRLDRLEAFKVLSDAYDHDDAFVRRFIHEAKLVASLDHPNIVKVYDFGEIDGIVWFSMQYVDGPTLRAELVAQGRLSPIAVVRLAISLLGALDYSHRLGTVHRDIKPSNILLDRRSYPYIMDFGIAKSSADVLKTMTGKILGTPAYISPEQIQGKTVDGRADVYALATAMYEMLAGRTPFQAEDALQILVKRMHEDPEPLSVYCFAIHERLEAIVMRALARQPEDRYPSADAMRQALIEFLGEESDQQEMTLMASAPEPRSIEKLPSTVPDQAVVVAAAAPTVKMRRSDFDDEAPTQVKKSGFAWAVGLTAVLALTIAMIVSLKPWDDSSPSPVSTVAAPPTAETDQQPEPTDSSTEPDEPPAVAVSVESAAPGAEAPGVESAVPPSPAKDLSEHPVAPSPPAAETAVPPAAETAVPPAAETAAPQQEASQAPSPIPIRRPVTVPKILSSAEPALPPDRAAECIGQSVIISLRVGEDGRALRSRILKAGPEVCSDAARLAAEAYVFEPARDSEGQPVAASTTLNIRFNEVTE